MIDQDAMKVAAKTITGELEDEAANWAAIVLADGHGQMEVSLFVASIAISLKRIADYLEKHSGQ